MKLPSTMDPWSRTLALLDSRSSRRSQSGETHGLMPRAFTREPSNALARAAGAEIGRGLCAYDMEDAQKIKGRASADIASILGFSGRAEMVHRDDLVVGRE